MPYWTCLGQRIAVASTGKFHASHEQVVNAGGEVRANEVLCAKAGLLAVRRLQGVAPDDRSKVARPVAGKISGPPPAPWDRSVASFPFVTAQIRSPHFLQLLLEGESQTKGRRKLREKGTTVN